MRTNRKSSSSSRVVESELRDIASRLRGVFGIPVRNRRLPDPLELLVATILSQNTNDRNSHKAFTNLKAHFPDFMSLAESSPRKIEPLIKIGGIANKKSKTIVQVVRDLREKFDAFDRRNLKRIDRDDLIENLCELNGVGYKTAACVSLFALGDDDAFPVDTHVHRILNRVGVVREKTPDKTYQAVKSSIPPRRGYELHINLIKFGRKVCTARTPKCYECPLFDSCHWNEKSRRQPSGLPADEKNVEFMLLESV